MKKDTFYSPWKKVAKNWEQYYFPPGRASKQDQTNYASFIKQAIRGKKGTALVLGSTPEIRNILHQFPLEVTCLDINLEMILAMNNFVPEWEKDILIKGSWIKNPLRENYYDVILGDLSWSNLPAKFWPQFHKTLRKILKNNGSYIHRVQIVPDNYRPTSVKEILLRYGKLPINPPHHFELMFELLTHNYNPKTKIISMGQLWKDVSPFWRPGKPKQLAAMPRINRLLNNLYSFWGPQNKEWAIGTATDLKSSLLPHFNVIKEAVASDHLFPEASPIWLCKVNK